MNWIRRSTDGHKLSRSSVFYRAVVDVPEVSKAVTQPLEVGEGTREGMPRFLLAFSRASVQRETHGIPAEMVFLRSFLSA
jgi:hypothetical protein